MKTNMAKSEVYRLPCVYMLMLFAVACSFLIPGGAQAKRLTLPKALTEIADEAFCGDESVTEVVLQENVQSIGARALSGCALESIVMPDSVISIPIRQAKPNTMNMSRRTAWIICWLRFPPIRRFRPTVYAGII